MGSPARSDAFGTAESILIDGANSVGGAPREHFPQAGVSAAAAGLAVLVTVALLRRRPRWVAALLAIAAVPGLALVLVLRADAPATRSAVAQRIGSTLQTLEAQAPWPSTPVRVVREDDDVLYPLGRYAWPSRPSGDAGVQLELRGDRLEPSCAVEPASAHLVCGAGP